MPLPIAAWSPGTLLEELGFPFPDAEWLQRNNELGQFLSAQKRRRLDGPREVDDEVAAWRLQSLAGRAFFGFCRLEVRLLRKLLFQVLILRSLSLARAKQQLKTALKSTHHDPESSVRALGF